MADFAAKIRNHKSVCKHCVPEYVGYTNHHILTKINQSKNEKVLNHPSDPVLSMAHADRCPQTQRTLHERCTSESEYTTTNLSREVHHPLSGLLCPAAIAAATAGEDPTHQTTLGGIGTRLPGRLSRGRVTKDERRRTKDERL